MIDRPIRPLFPKDWRFDTQLVAIPVSIDHVHPYDILAMNGASTALMLSDIPLPTPVGAVRIGKIDGNFVVNPEEPSLLEDAEDGSDLDLDRRRHRRRDPDGRGGRERDPRGRDPRRARHRPRRDQEAVRAAARAGREGRQAEESLRADRRRRRCCSSRSAARTARSSTQATQVEDKLERQDATKAVEEAILAQYGPAAPEGAGEEQLVAAKDARQAAQLAFDKLEKSDHPRAHRGPEEAPGRPLARTRSATSRSRSA